MQRVSVVFYRQAKYELKSFSFHHETVRDVKVTRKGIHMGIKLLEWNIANISYFRSLCMYFSLLFQTRAELPLV